MSKRNISTLLCMILCVGMCAVFVAGCGGEYAGLTEGDTVSGSAVSGEAVSGDSIKEKTVSDPTVKDKKDAESQKGKQDMSSHRFCTDTNLYYVSENGEKLMQARTDDTHRKCIKELPGIEDTEICNYIELLNADENWLYYVVTRMDEEITYRAPVEKDAKGYDVVRISKEEELLNEGRTLSLYMDADYYFYVNLETYKRIKYDLKKKKKVSQEKVGIQEDCQIFGLKDYYVKIKYYEKMYTQKIDSTRWKEITDFAGFSSVGLESVQNGEEFFYFMAEPAEADSPIHICRNDGKTEHCFVTWEQLNRAVAEAARVKKADVCMPVQLFWQRERLYIQMQAGWTEQETYHMEYMIFSQGKEDSGLRYEKELTECMKSYVKERNGKWSDYDKDYPDQPETTVFVEHMVVNDAQCIAMVDGTAYLSLPDFEKNRERLACYDLDTGKFTWVTGEDAVFYKLGYDNDLYSKFGTVFNELDCNLYMDMFFSPSVDQENDGQFVEDE